MTSYQIVFLPIVFSFLKLIINTKSMLKILFLVFVALQIIEAKLQQIFSLSRHGARYHIQDFYDGNSTKQKWLQLTPVGMRQNQRLGQLIRREYVQNLRFLNPIYNKSEIEVYSSRTNRTISSGTSFLYGLYPPGFGPELTFASSSLHLPPYSNKTDSKEVKYALQEGFQPIIVQANENLMINKNFMEKKEVDYGVLSVIECPNFNKNQKRNFEKHSKQVSQMMKQYQPFLHKMSKLFGFPLKGSNLQTFKKLFDVTSVDLYLGRALPNDFSNQDYINLKHLSQWYWFISMANNNSVMVNHFKLKRLINTFDMRIETGDSYPLKWSHFIGHQNDVIAIHVALNTSSSQCIEQLYRNGHTSALQCENRILEYTSNLIIQLHSDPQESYYVKVRWNGRYLKICREGFLTCDYQQFKELISKSMSKIDMHIICGKKAQNKIDSVERSRKQLRHRIEI